MTTQTTTQPLEELDLKNQPHIEIEQMLFGDYRVQVWDENLNSKLDREYFCRSYQSAYITANAIQLDFYPDYPIYYRAENSIVKVQ